MLGSRSYAHGSLVVLAVTAMVACGGSEQRLDEPLARTGFPDNPAAMRGAADYLVRHLDADGRFVYRTHAGGQQLTPRYNVLRHAGSIYALAEYNRQWPSKEIEKAILRGARYLSRRHIGALPSKPDILAIWSLPGEEIRTDVREAKLGGAALAIVALTMAAELDPTVISRKKLQRLGELILYMQKPSGEFHSKFIESPPGFDNSFHSLYYPGEAMLALSRLYKLDGDQRWLDAAAKAAVALARERAGQKRLPPDHWYMIAAREIVPPLMTIDPESGEIIREHATVLADQMLAAQRSHAIPALLVGSFGSDGRSTPTATRLEGLAAVHDVLDEGDPRRAKVRQALATGTAFLRRCQLAAGPLAGGVMRALAPRAGSNGDNDRFNRRQAEIRIDYVQHAMSAMQGAQRLGATR